MFILKNTSIKNKLILIQIATALVAVVICCVIFVINDLKIFKANNISNKYSIAEILGLNSIAPLLFNDHESAKKILMSLDSNPSILNAAVYDKNGNLFAVYNKSGEPDFSFSNDGFLTSGVLEGQIFIVNYRIFQKKEFLGTVWIRSEVTALNNIVTGYIKVAILVLVIALISTAIISFFLQKVITRPIEVFIKKTKDISEKGDYSGRLIQYGKDEIGILSEEFNHMLSQIQQMELSLKEVNTKLEERVKLRTLELETANKELKMKSEDLVRSNLELEQFAYIASHDLQEPLRTISNYVGLFKKQFGENKFDKNASQYLNYILGATERMQTLIIDLLSYSRIGHYHNIDQVDCNEVMKEILKDFDALIKMSNAKITIDKLPVIEGHYSEIKSLFQNVLSNAIKFRKKDVKPVIKIYAEERKSEWLFAIKDNGIGINEAYHDKLFKIFQRLHSQSEYSGTGIGLAQCKKIVEIHGGRIWVDSVPGMGSTFYFTIQKSYHF
jgi:signal transduction histidine kinase